MTDDTDPLDELASAHLDGQTTPEEAARVEADPALLDRVARLSDARASLRATGDAPIDPQRRDRAIAAALAAFDEDAAPVALTTPVAPAAVRRLPTRRTLRLVGLAAAVVLLALTVPLIGRLSSGSDDDTAGVAVDKSGDGDSREDTDEASGFAETTAAPSTADLGSYADLDTLTEAVRAQLQTTASRQSDSATVSTTASALSGEASYDAGTPCLAELSAGAPVRLSALAVLDGRPVVIGVRENPDGSSTLVVLDRADCSSVTARSL